MSTLDPSRLQALARIATPLGEMTAAASARGLAGLWFDGQAHHPGPLDLPRDDEQRWLRATREALARYFGGPSAAPPQPEPRPDPQPNPLEDLPLDLQGTPFQQAVWQALRGIGRGRTTSYGALAQQIGRPAAVRAAAAAVGRNPVSILVPCHRVLGRDGALTGYAGGLARKQALLRHEGVALS